MLTRLREIVEKVAAVVNLNEALELLVNETCQAMKVEVCSIYLADEDRQCYYLMATRGLKKPRGRPVTLAFDEGVVGQVGRLAEPLNFADVQRHPHFKLIPQLNEEPFQSFLGVPIIYRRQLLGVLVIQQREQHQFDESEESFLVTLATQMAGILSQAQLHGIFTQYRKIRIRALPASPGIAIAEGWVDSTHPPLEGIHQASTLDIVQERERLNRALEEATAEFRRFSKRFEANAQKESAAVFDLYTHLLNDPRLRRDWFAEIDTGSSAEWAVKVVVEHFAQQFASLNDGYMRERATDLKALGQRLLFHLDDTFLGIEQWPERFILVADELTATALAELPQDRVQGVVVRDGAANSHAAIMVRALGLPMVIDADIQPELLNQRLLIIDGYTGELLVEPEPMLVREYQQLINEERVLSRLAEDDIDQPAALKSGEAITILLNAGLSSEHEQLLGAHVDGIGLYRTELPFMLQSGFPSEDEQVIQYREMLSLFPQQPVTLRTLDIGADKQLPYLPISEENPYLGWRGIRITLDQPEIFLVQVRAMLRANADFGNLQILLPMVTSLDEIKQADRLITRALDEVSTLLETPQPKPKLGVMLEVPSLLFLMEYLAKHLDFISVGSNDLTQYLLAVDRNNTHVAALYDPLHPAVLRALQQIIAQAPPHLSVSICGELAADPVGALLLVGMGYSQLSMNSRSVAKIKYLLRHVVLQELQELVRQVLQVGHVADVRACVAQFMRQHSKLSALSRGVESTLEETERLSTTGTSGKLP